MKILFEHCDEFEYSLVKTNKIKKLNLSLEKCNKPICFNNCVLSRVCLEKYDEFINIDKAINLFTEVSKILKVKKFIIFPFAHLSKDLLEYKKAEELFNKLNNILSKQFETGFIPLGFDKKYKTNVKGHSFNVMLRTLNALENIDNPEYKLYDEILYSKKNYKILLRELSVLPIGNVLEVGAGTGNLTTELLKNYNISSLDVIEHDNKFITEFQKKLRIPIKKADALRYKSKKKYDIIISSLVYHHISDKEKLLFLKQIYNNLKHKGRIILGDCFINNYANEKQRNDSFKRFYKSRINNEKNHIIQEVQRNYLRESLSRTGEWKTSVEFLITQLKQTRFNNIIVKKIGNQQNGGYKIVIAEK